MIRWAISTDFVKPGFPNIRKSLDKAGIEYFHSSFDPVTRQYDQCPYDAKDGPVVLYGPIRFVKAHASKHYIPGAYGFTNATRVSSYRCYYDNDIFANDEYIMLPWGSLIANQHLIEKCFGKSVFIRPDSGMKSFTGFVCQIDDLRREHDSLQQLVNPDGSEICMISKSQQINAEYRFVVCNGEVVTGSQYTWEGIGDARQDVDPAAYEFATHIARLDYQIDTCYTLDIFMTDRGPKIGEFNSFASAGLYHCNLDKIVETVSNAAIEEWKS